MDARIYVGRVGALAAAIGIGVATYPGCGVASADSLGPQPSDTAQSPAGGTSTGNDPSPQPPTSESAANSPKPGAFRFGRAIRHFVEAGASVSAGGSRRGTTPKGPPAAQPEANASGANETPADDADRSVTPMPAAVRSHAGSSSSSTRFDLTRSQPARAVVPAASDRVATALADKASA